MTLEDRRTDPTQNVRDLVALHSSAMERFINSELKGLEKLNEAKFTSADEQFKAHLVHSTETAIAREREFKTHIDNGMERFKYEQDRINAVIVDMKKSVEDDKAQTIETAKTLSNTVDVTAESNRVKLEQTKEALRQANDQQMETLRLKIEAKDIENEKKFKALEDAKSEGVGKSRVTDPMFTALIAKMDALNKSNIGTEIKFSGIQLFGGWILPILVTVIIALFMYFK